MMIQSQKLFEILKDLVRIPSFSGEEQDLVTHIQNTHCSNKGWIAEVDDFHNMYIHRVEDDGGKCLPLLNAHLDIHPRGDTVNNRETLRGEHFLTLVDGAVRKSHEIQAGFDDKAGVASILYLMSEFKNLDFRVLFTTQEERTSQPRFGRKGGGGIDHALMESFPDVFEKTSWVITLDREHGKDIIVAYGNNKKQNQPEIRLCSEEFEEWIIQCSEEVDYRMSVTEGRMGDPYNIRQTYPELDCVNFSCGIYNEHSDTESLNFNETMKVIEVVIQCLKSRFEKSRPGHCGSCES